MANWVAKVKIKHLLTDGEGHEEVQANMNAIADVIEASSAFMLFSRKTLEKMRNIPQGNDDFSPTDYANKYLDKMYDFADEHRIWLY
jgi:ribosomal protein S12 methylthiotransferase accessory factor YcaO